MNEEVIEKIKHIYRCKDSGDFYTRDDVEAIEQILSITEKQQKEINRLNDENELLKIITKQYNSYCINTNTDDEPRIILAHKNYFDSGVFTSNFISKDKIREKLNYFEHSYDYDDNGESYELVMEILDELLEEK